MNSNHGNNFQSGGQFQFGTPQRNGGFRFQATNSNAGRTAQPRQFAPRRHGDGRNNNYNRAPFAQYNGGGGGGRQTRQADQLVERQIKQEIFFERLTVTPEHYGDGFFVRVYNQFNDQRNRYTTKICLNYYAQKAGNQGAGGVWFPNGGARGGLTLYANELAWLLFDYNHTIGDEQQMEGSFRDFVVMKTTGTAPNGTDEFYMITIGNHTIYFRMPVVEFNTLKENAEELMAAISWAQYFGNPGEHSQMDPPPQPQSTYEYSDEGRMDGGFGKLKPVPLARVGTARAAGDQEMRSEEETQGGGGDILPPPPPPPLEPHPLSVSVGAWRSPPQGNCE